MKNILMIGTGGTIASGQTAEGLAPELDPLQLLRDTPRVAQLCRVDCLQLYSLDSTNIRPCHWLGLARAIRERYDQYDGFVISHGTDTMAYTAAALSYLIQDCPKPSSSPGPRSPSGTTAPTPSATSPTRSCMPAGAAAGCRSCSTARSFWAPVPARPSPRASRPSPASTIRSWP